MGGGGSKEAGGVPSPFPLVANFQDKLLQPPDDDSILQTWVMLRSAIDAHARRFYHCERVRQTRELGDKDARIAGLADLAGMAVELGEKIFCHAARWRFEWKPPAEELEEKLAEEGSRRRSIVVFPALLRSDEEGTKERGGLKYIIIKRKAVSAGSFFDVPVPVRKVQDSSSSSSSGSDSETPEEPPARGRRRMSRRN
ncbi:hypothetical protein MAPG_00182 [Magnaporthiopsis poae ATCC 64411]|uniref:Uncharacterized protein n=1 Tax=Magnaporthiopsis poae (strain ATCC 64411 / 73-15) TaxID=644358 RepID=A0A0C4DKB6_MAGP6|nr:hypothetical protein MAPG_00182 [Magnaporthiopsis poae ATCC 64411]